MSQIDTDKLNYTILVPFNESLPTGGDSLTENLNIHYEVRCHPSPAAMGKQPS